MRFTEEPLDWGHFWCTHLRIPDLPPPHSSKTDVVQAQEQQALCCRARPLQCPDADGPSEAPAAAPVRCPGAASLPQIRYVPSSAAILNRVDTHSLYALIITLNMYLLVMPAPPIIDMVPLIPLPSIPPSPRLCDGRCP